MLHTRRPRVLFVPALIVAVCIAGFLVLGRVHAGGRAVPGEPFDPYLHRTTGALADPVNIVFEGGDAAAVAQAVQRVLGWPRVTGGAMVFEDRGVTRETAWQFGLPLSTTARLHLRIEADVTPGRQPYVLVGVHRDDTTACGHVGHSFNRSRDTVAAAFIRLGYAVSRVRLNNTQPGRQCDGSMTAGDGLVAVIDLRSGTLPADAPLFPVGSALLPPIYLSLP